MLNFMHTAMMMRIHSILRVLMFMVMDVFVGVFALMFMDVRGCVRAHVHVYGRDGVHAL